MVDVREATRLEWFIQTQGLKPAHVAREAMISRQHLVRLRRGEMDPTRKVMLLIRRACSKLTGKRVRLSALFELDGKQ